MNAPTPDSSSAALGYWDSFYAGQVSAAVPDNPSAFARWVDAELGSPRNIVELGFGTARDSFWFVDRGHAVTGFDGAHSAVELANSHAAEHGMEAAFHQLDLMDDAAVPDAAEPFVDRSATDVYARFLLHSLPLEGRLNVLRFAARALGPDGRLFLEFRTGKDAHEEHAFGNDHFRVYLDADDVADQIREVGGTVDHLEQGHGLAVYKSEDPHVARIVARWGQANR